MGKGHTAVRQWMSNKARFADLFNGFVFQGRQVVLPEDLEMNAGESDILVEDKRDTVKDIQRYRDITMKWNQGGQLTILACENQAKVHYAMPVRNMLYDSLVYIDQIKQIWNRKDFDKTKLTKEEFLSRFRKGDKIVPVITLVFYYDIKKWDGNIELYDMFGVGLEERDKIILEAFIPNYKINLVDAGNMKNIERFQTDLQEIFGMLQCRNKKSELIEYMKKNEKYFRNIDEETYYAIREFLHSEKILKGSVEMKLGEETIDMCKALEDLYNEGVEIGEARGIEQTKLDVAQKLLDILDVETIAEAVGLSVEKIQTMKNSVGIKG